MSTATKELKSDLFEGFEFEAAPVREELERIAKDKGQLMSELAPGVWVVGMSEFEIPSHVICRLVPAEVPGTFTLAPEPWPGYVRMSDDIGRRLGVIGLAATAMRRLMWGGYVEHIRPTCGAIFISIESLLDHFRRTANDGTREKSYWSPARREHWRSIIDAGTEFEE